jgi:hypothetical protein
MSKWLSKFGCRVCGLFHSRWSSWRYWLVSLYWRWWGFFFIDLCNSCFCAFGRKCLCMSIQYLSILCVRLCQLRPFCRDRFIVLCSSLFFIGKFILQKWWNRWIGIYRVLCSCILSDSRRWLYSLAVGSVS